jgi:broad specificity phosphatase PhoE
MSALLPIVCLARHGETAWSLSGQHTGLTDLPLTERGELDAQSLGRRLQGFTFEKVFTSPLKRATRTCDLAGFGSEAEADRDLVEWNYGEYEGRRTREIHEQRPDWQLFRDGCPGGETADQVGDRADRVVARVRRVSGNVLLFSSAHFLRVLTARWLGLDAAAGRYFLLETASLSILGYEHNLSEPAIRLWNDARHVEDRSVRFTGSPI